MSHLLISRSVSMTNISTDKYCNVYLTGPLVKCVHSKLPLLWIWFRAGTGCLTKFRFTALSLFGGKWFLRRPKCFVYSECGKTNSMFFCTELDGLPSTESPVLQQSRRERLHLTDSTDYLLHLPTESKPVCWLKTTLRNSDRDPRLKNKA